MYIDDLYDKSIKKMKNIAKLKKMDLHIHSPASKDYIRSKKDIDVMKEYEKFINKFIDSDLDVIAITDHNTIEGYKQIKDIINKNFELRGKLNGKYILPGIEVTCFSRHFLIYFSEGTKISVIEEFIKRCGIDNEKDNDKASADRVTPLTLCEIANEYNAFICLPHADGDKGFLKDYIKTSKKDEEFIINGGIVEKVLKSPNMLGVCISNESNRNELSKLIKNFNKDLKIFKASDSHSILNIENYKGSGKPMGTQFFYANLGELNFRTIKSFFKNPNTQIFESIPIKKNPYIISTCLKGSFVKNKSKDSEWEIIPFSRELNCFIGARGTGKSTIIDIIKYAFNFYDTETYYNSNNDDYLIYNVDEVEEYDETEEKENIISRFDEIVLFVNKDNEIYAITVAPTGINSPNVTIYNYKNKFKKQVNSVRLDTTNMDKIISFLSDIKPIIYQQKNILEIGNNKMKVTKTIYSIIERIIGREYQELCLEKNILQNEVNELCKKIEIERNRDENAENNSRTLISKYNKLFDVSEKVNTYNIEILEKMNKILNDKLILTYEIDLPRRYKENIIDEIVKNNKYKSNFSGYEKELELRKSLKFLFSKISNTHDLLYLLFTNQYMEISRKTGLDEGLSKGACEYTYKYFQSNYVSNIPQVIIDFKLNVNYGMSKKKIYRERTNLSFGQKAVGILLILLYGTTISDNNQLLILDQPEDDLDNAYVYHTLVKELDRVKEKRQLIVATHSPNIAVAGNSENIIVLKGNGENSWIECSGTIYNNAVSKEAINILEGNEIAFKERAELYGIII